MYKEIIVTPTSQRIADAINREMKDRHITPTMLEQSLEGKLNKPSVRRIRKGSSGIGLRYYEIVLDFLGLRLIAVPKKHPDIIDVEENDNEN